MSTPGGQHDDLLKDESLSLNVAWLRLRLDPEQPAPKVDHLRAAIATIEPELDLLHQHGKDGLIYRYPRVIYQIQEGRPQIVAVAEGIAVLMGLTLVGQSLRLGTMTRRIIDATFHIREQQIGPTQAPRRYRLAAPWLALNQENYARFVRMDAEQRQQFLNAQVANNCLSLAQSLGLRITTRLVARARVRPVPVWLKQVEMLGFLGEIEVNFQIPYGLGLGKSVSKGFGAIQAEG